MASNVRGGSNDAALPLVATDDVAGTQYQRVKLDVGADGASTPVGASGLPVNDAGGSLTVDGTVTAAQATAANLNATVVGTGTFAVQATGSVTANAGTNLNTSALALDATLTANGVLVGAVNETAPATDTANSGTNGRLQRIAQRLTSLIALLPASLGQKASSASLAVTIASDQSAVPASQSGTWTVQPGNTANTTAWKVDASSVAVPVTDNSGSLTVDAPVATPVFVRLSDGAAAITTLPVSVASVPSHDVTNAGTFAVQATSLIPGTAATSLGKAEDSLAVDGDTGVAMLAVRADLPSTITSLTGDYHFLTTDSAGRQWVRSDALETILLDQNDLIRALLVETRISNYLLQSGLNVKDEPEDFRNDPSFSLVN